MSAVLKFPETTDEPTHADEVPGDGDGSSAWSRLSCPECGSRHFFVMVEIDRDNARTESVEYECNNCGLTVGVP